jgi:polyisoprenoid-binding protein YceI
MGRLVAFWLALLALPGSLRAADAVPVRIELSPSNTSVIFVGTNPVTKQTGRFVRLKGLLSLDRLEIERSAVQIAIDMDSVETSDQMLTRHLKSADFFDVQRFSTASFESTAVRPSQASGSTYLVSGALEIKGVKRNVDFSITLDLVQNRITAAGELTIDRRVFNVASSGFTDSLIRDDVIVRIRIEAVRP